MNVCECGCGQQVQRRFVRGHHGRKARVIEGGTAKTCTKCQKPKALSEFPLNKKAADGRGSWCHACQNEYGKGRRPENRSPYNPENDRVWRLRNRYGLTPEEYDQMHAEQDGKCAICGRTPAEAGGRWGRLVVDHSHETDEVRGLLCASCNNAIGLLQDDPEIIMSAAAYLLARQLTEEVS